VVREKRRNHSLLAHAGRVSPPLETTGAIYDEALDRVCGLTKRGLNRPDPIEARP
jgi:hypothetical protein